jgi:serine/threonine-protein kinase RsbW/stage II sporulation protein AB (anti-sigma F factor)
MARDASMNPRALVRRLRAQPDQVRVIRAEVRAFAVEHGAADPNAVALAVSEAVTNAVVHAYVDAPEPGEIEVVARRTGDDCLEILVSDAGRGMLPRPDSPGVGLGLPLVAAAYHDPRTKDWYTAQATGRAVQDVQRTLGDVKQPIFLQEPMPYRAICRGQEQDSVAGHFIAAAGHARTAGAAAWTLHTRVTFDLTTGSLVSKLGDPANTGLKTVLENLPR